MRLVSTQSSRIFFMLSTTDALGSIFILFIVFIYINHITANLSIYNQKAHKVHCAIWQG